MCLSGNFNRNIGSFVEVPVIILHPNSRLSSLPFIEDWQPFESTMIDILPHLPQNTSTIFSALSADQENKYGARTSSDATLLVSKPTTVIKENSHVEGYEVVRSPSEIEAALNVTFSGLVQVSQ